MKYVVRMAAVCAAVTVAVLIAGCKQPVGNSGEKKPADKTYTVDGVSFRMMNINAVTDGMVGHDDQNNNKPALQPTG